MPKTPMKKPRPNPTTKVPSGVAGLVWIYRDGEDEEAGDPPGVALAPDQKYPTGKRVVLSGKIRHRGEVENSFVEPDITIFAGVLGPAYTVEGGTDVYVELREPTMVYPRVPDEAGLSGAHQRELAAYEEFEESAFSSFTPETVDGAFFVLDGKVFVRVEPDGDTDDPDRFVFAIHDPVPSNEIIAVDLTPGEHYNFNAGGVNFHGMFVAEGPDGFVFKCPRFMQPDMQGFNDRTYIVSSHQGLEDEFTLGSTFVAFPSISLE